MAVKNVLDYNREVFNDLVRYGTILTDHTFEALNVRIQTVRDRSGNIWFVRHQNGSTYDCFNLSEYNGTVKQVFYKPQ